MHVHRINMVCIAAAAVPWYNICLVLQIDQWRYFITVFKTIFIRYKTEMHENKHIVDTIYTRQNMLRVTSRSKQCNSIFSKMPGLIPMSDWFYNLTADTLWSDEQFPVKIFFSKSSIFEISKILIFNPKSENLYFQWLVNHFSLRLVKRALINKFLTTLGAYSDSRRFFQYEISPLFFVHFPKS